MVSTACRDLVIINTGSAELPGREYLEDHRSDTWIFESDRTGIVGSVFSLWDR